MTDDHAKEPSYLSPEQLRVGVYVIIELPWFKHPFSLNNFKVSDTEQVRELRALGLQRYRYDPDRTDPPPAGWTAPSSTTAAIAPAGDLAEPATTPDLPSEPPATPAMEEKHRQIQVLQQHREKLARVEKTFAKASTVMRNLNRNLFSRPKESLDEMGELVAQMIEAFLERPEATVHVMGEKAGGEDVYFHSLNVTILAMMLAKDLGFSTEAARELGTAAMLHDIGRIEIPDRVLKKHPDEFNKAEQNLYCMHVDYGVEIGRKLGISAQALQIIAQHHEFCDGTGYPKGLKEAAISPGGRLVSLVNYYDELCNPIDLNKAMTPHAALSFMFSQNSAKFEKRALQLMIRNLGVYPPGSIVQLSNEALAAVISINPKKPLRPWVLVYDANVPKEEAVMIDLEAKTDISITKSIRPALLPPQVVAYLNPRKRVTYFFDSDQGAAGPAAKRR